MLQKSPLVFIILMISLCCVSENILEDLPESQTERIITAIGTAASSSRSPVLIMTPFDGQFFNDIGTTLSGNYCSISYPNAMNLSWAYCGGNSCSFEVYSMPDDDGDRIDYYRINEYKMWSDCKITTGRTVNDTYASIKFISPNMYHLDLSRNVIDKFPKGFFCGLKKLKNLYLSRTLLTNTNDLGFLPGEMCQLYTGCCLCRLKNLNLKSNNFGVIKKGTFCGLKEVVKLNLTSSNISSIEENGLGFLFSLLKLDLSKNKLTTFDKDAFIDTAKLEYLDLSDNIIHDIPATTFKSLSNLTTLLLSNNNISFLREGLLDNQKALVTLDLQNNRLEHVSQGIFAYLFGLKHLNMSQNKLKSIEDSSFNNLMNLNYLTISDNKLTSYPVWNLTNLLRLKSLGIHRNPWTCDCDYVKNYRDYLQSYSNILQLTNELYCLKNEKEKMPLIGFNMGYCYSVNGTNDNVKFSESSLIWGTLLAIFLCLTLIAILAFRYRYEMQVLIFSRYGLRFGTNKPDTTNKMFDVFISYSSLDEEFLVQQIMPNLEEIEKPYNLCLHHRTFAPGAFIINSIMEAVEQSAVTLILLSDNFIQSEWCRFEFKTAHMQMLKDRCNRIIIILIGDEIPADLDQEMKLYTKTNTYLKFNDSLFWKKLYFALPDRNEKPELETINTST
ncbi:TOLL-like receptor [Chamberlinius hualienensis]